MLVESAQTHLSQYAMRAPVKASPAWQRGALSLFVIAASSAGSKGVKAADGERVSALN